MNPGTGDIVKGARHSVGASPGIALRESSHHDLAERLSPNSYARFRLQEHIKSLARP